MCTRETYPAVERAIDGENSVRDEPTDCTRNRGCNVEPSNTNSKLVAAVVVGESVDNPGSKGSLKSTNQESNCEREMSVRRIYSKTLATVACCSQQCRETTIQSTHCP